MIYKAQKSRKESGRTGKPEDQKDF